MIDEAKAQAAGDLLLQALDLLVGEFDDLPGLQIDQMVVMVFRRGDVMTEWFYDDRWYNVFKVEDDTGERLKGYYCNITRPAEISESTIAADDLALDVFVSPEGEITLLDEDDFAALPLTDEERQSAREAVEQIRTLLSKRESPFDF